MKLTGGQDDLGAALASLRRPQGNSAPSRALGPLGTRAKWVGLAGVGVLALASAVVLTRRDSRPAPAPAVAAVPASPARPGSIACTGYVEEEEHARVASTVMARLVKVSVREGDPVKAGQRLVDLDTTELEATLAATRARASAAAARSDVASFSRDESALATDRERRLVTLGATPKATVDDADARLRVLGASLVAARADAAAARAEAAVLESRLALHHVDAPFDGVVVTRPLAVGDVAVPGAPLLELAGALVVAADVPEARMARLALGARAHVHFDALPGAEDGVIVGFAPRIDKAKATATVKVRLTRAELPLRVGMAARVELDERTEDSK